jgi:hypothetical protein
MVFPIVLFTLYRAAGFQTLDYLVVHGCLASLALFFEFIRSMDTNFSLVFWSPKYILNSRVVFITLKMMTGPQDKLVPQTSELQLSNRRFVFIFGNAVNAATFNRLAFICLSLLGLRSNGASRNGSSSRS